MTAQETITNAIKEASAHHGVPQSWILDRDKTHRTGRARTARARAIRYSRACGVQVCDIAEAFAICESTVRQIAKLSTLPPMPVA